MACKYSDIRVTPEEIKIITKEGYRFLPPYQYIKLEKASHDLTPSWAAATDADWLSVKPTSGTVPDKVRVKADARDMAAGIYHGQIIFSSEVEVSPSQVMVILEVKPLMGPLKEEPEIPEEKPEEKTEELPEEKPVPEPEKPQPEPKPDIAGWIERILAIISKILVLWQRIKDVLPKR